MNVYEILGSIGTGIRCVMLIPQIHKVIKVNSGETLSYTSLLTQSLSSLLILAYGIGINKYLIIINNFSTLIATVLLIGLKHHYHKKGKLLLSLTNEPEPSL